MNWSLLKLIWPITYVLHGLEVINIHAAQHLCCWPGPIEQKPCLWCQIAWAESTDQLQCVNTVWEKKSRQLGSWSLRHFQGLSEFIHLDLVQELLTHNKLLINVNYYYYSLYSFYSKPRIQLSTREWNYICMQKAKEMWMQLFMISMLFSWKSQARKPMLSPYLVLTSHSLPVDMYNPLWC